MKKYDIVVIGSGPAGHVAALKAVKKGKSVAVVERAELGGVCLNWGCIPTKAMLKSAQVFHYIEAAEQYGIELEGHANPSLDKIVARSRAVAAQMNKGIDFLFKKAGIDVLVGNGRIASKGVVEVTAADGSTESVEADHIILATGSRPREIPIMPVDGKRIISSKEALTLSELPESMIIVGSGAIGCEFAWVYAALGVKVTVVEYLPNMLPLADEEVSRTLERAFRKMKVTVLTSTGVKAVRVGESGCEVDVEGKKGLETLNAEVVLSAVGVKSNLEGLGLEELGVAIERDKVVVDKYFRTNVEGIYAVGDIIATPALAHVASAEATVCIEAICGHEPAPIDYSTIPSCVYTTPEVAMVGLTEKQATEQGYQIKVGKYQFMASGKATAAGDRDGFVKLIYDAESEKLLGAHIIGGSVTEMLGEPTLAKQLGITARQIAQTVHSHPTMYEGLLEATEAILD
ncbi:MAG: dihydrolipoyl dehydrogenase [Tidjanibacter sp.]|nr:dihydrolipoyl dehydrogenase [Tidjanibacter sp.]